jgi:hypothetical protein
MLYRRAQDLKIIEVAPYSMLSRIEHGAVRVSPRSRVV